MQEKAVCEAVLIKIPIVVGTFLTTNHSTSPIRKQLNLSEQLKVMSSNYYNKVSIINFYIIFEVCDVIAVKSLKLSFINFCVI